MTRRRHGIWWISAIGVSSALLHVVVQSAQETIGRGSGVGGHGLLVGSARYAAATAGLFALYLLLLRMCSRGWLASRSLQALALGFPVGFNLLFLATPPRLSSDVLSYIAHGFIRAGMGGNPYLHPEAAVLGTPIAAELEAYGWGPGHPPTPYGPLWTTVEVAVVRAFDDVALQIPLFKGVAMLASLACAVVIWMILSQVRPQHRLLGTMAFLWNPMVIVEFSGEGHIDAVMVLFVLAAIALAVRRREAAAVVALWGGVLTKLLPLVFLPILAVWGWRTSGHAMRTVRRLAAGMGVGLVASVAAFWPFWAGTATFRGVRGSGRTGQTGSTVTVAVEAFTRGSGLSPPSSVVILLSLALLGAVVAWAAWSAVDNDALLRGFAVVSVVYLVVVSPNYWPWYATLPVALLLLLPRGLPIALAIALSLGARMVAPLDMLYEHAVLDRPGFLVMTWVLGIVMPVVVFATGALLTHSHVAVRVKGFLPRVRPSADAVAGGPRSEP